MKTTTFATNKWMHIAVSRESGTSRLFLDGVLIDTQSDSYDIVPSSNLNIGAYNNGGLELNGFVQDARIYNGLAKYTQNFIPASTDPDILPDTPSGVSYSSNVALVPSTDGAVAFDGTNDTLSIADSADFDIGTGDFTFECFTYYTKTGSYTGILSPQNYSDNGLVIGTFATGNKLRIVNPTQIDIIGTSDISNKWVHIAVSRSGTTLRGFVNGIQEISTTYSNSIDFADGGSAIVGNLTAGGFYFQGFISNLRLIKGTALYTSNFTPPTAPLTSVANTKLLCCKSNSSATAFDVSPGTITSVNAIASNFNPFTANINTQRGQESGYCTLNPLEVSSTYITLSNGNLKTESVQGGSSYQECPLNIPVNFNNNNKWYVEFYPEAVYSTYYPSIGISPETKNFTSINVQGGDAGGGTAYMANGQKYNGASLTSYASSYTAGDTIGVAVDESAGTITMYKNNISQGILASSLTGVQLITVTHTSVSGQSKCSVNCGQKPFKFPPPAGFQPLALANLPRPTIVRPDQYVGIVTYTGNSTDNRKITTGFKPDFVWIKSRSNSGAHALFDSIRGTAMLDSQATSAESAFGSPPIGGYLNTFERDGFTLKNGSTNNTYVNESAYTYVAWAWKAGGNSNTFNINDIGYSTASAAGLTAGTITPTGASVNTKSGFSILTHSGSGSTGTISHGLQKEPAFIITKIRTSGVTSSWQVYHQSLGATKYITLDETAGAQTSSTRWNDTTPTSSLISLGSNTAQSYNWVIYAWAEIPGFSKFGSYTGNNSTDGPVVITGFRPRWIMIKRIDATGGQWSIWDTSRDTYNPSGTNLWADSSEIEATSSSYYIDVLSNGFKLRNTHVSRNASGVTYIYAAFAEAPTFNLYGAQSNAR